MLHLKHACFGIWPFERGILYIHVMHACWYMAYRTRNIRFETRFLWFMAYRTMLHLKRACFGIWLIEQGIV